jgi:hypothetical protein
MIPSKSKLDGIAQRGAANRFHQRAIAKPHLQKAPANPGVALNGHNRSRRADFQLIQAANRLAARLRVACLLGRVWHMVFCFGLFEAVYLN